MKKKYGFLIHFLIKMGLLVAAGYLVWTYALCFHRISGNNMFPAGKDGDLGIVYQLEECHTGDLVWYESPDGTGKYGRIVAVPGQEVDFPEEGGYLVNGYQPAEEVLYETYRDKESGIKYPVTLVEDEYFILNDYRDDTADSRDYGPIKASAIKGKVIFLLRRRGF